MTPAGFLKAHNPEIGTGIIKAGYTPGRLAVMDNCPTLENVSAIYGEDTAIAWLNVQLSTVDLSQGSAGFGDMMLRDIANRIYAIHKRMAVASLLLFFTLYRSSEYTDAVKHVGGSFKIFEALKLYNKRANDEANRIIHEQEIEKAYQERLSWGKRKSN